MLELRLVEKLHNQAVCQPLEPPPYPPDPNKKGVKYALQDI